MSDEHAQADRRARTSATRAVGHVFFDTGPSAPLHADVHVLPTVTAHSWWDPCPEVFWAACLRSARRPTHFALPQSPGTAWNAVT